MNDWNIQGRAHGCQACAKPFIDKQPYHTLLFDNKQLYERLDICHPCWEAQYSQGASERKGFISYWQGVYEAPPPPAPEAIQKENAESLLRKIIESSDPRHSAASYILAVMLERKRHLKIKEQYFRDGQRVFVYEHGKSGDIFTIPDPNLQLDQLEQVQREVSELLEHGFPTEAAVAPSPAPEGEVQPPANAEAGEAQPTTEATTGDGEADKPNSTGTS